MGPNQCLQDFSNFRWIPNLEKLSHWVDDILVDYAFDIHDNTGSMDSMDKVTVAVHGGRSLRDHTIEPMVSTSVVKNDSK
jgi:hypothetical protein